jgi:hypothetical protein
MTLAGLPICLLEDAEAPLSLVGLHRTTGRG